MEGTSNRFLRVAKSTQVLIGVLVAGLLVTLFFVDWIGVVVLGVLLVALLVGEIGLWIGLWRFRFTNKDTQESMQELFRTGKR